MLAFFDAEVIEKALAAMQPFCDRLEIILVENASEHSHTIREVVWGFMRSGLVSRYFFFLENVSGIAVSTILRQHIDCRAHEFVMLCDADIAPLDPDWLDEEISVLRNHPEVYAIGGTLEMSNLPLAQFSDADTWVAPPTADHGDYLEGPTGGWGLLFRGPQLAAMLEHLANRGERLIDGEMWLYCYGILGLRWARTKRAKVYHLTWDSYQNPDHPYTRYKRGKSLTEHWRHERTSEHIEITDPSDRRGLAISQAAM